MLTTYQEHVRIGNKIMHKENILPALLGVCIKESVCLWENEVKFGQSRVGLYMNINRLDKKTEAF